MRQVLAVIAVFGVVLSTYSTAAQQQKKSAQPKPSIQDIEKQQKRHDDVAAERRRTSDLKNIQVFVTDAVESKRLDCMRAFGHEKFCGCIVHQIPATTDFAQYVMLVTTRKDKLVSADTWADEKDFVNSIYRARETCVATSF